MHDLDSIPRDKRDLYGRPRRGDWIQTYRGRQFWPLDPFPSDFDIVDIAAALSKATRYAGHCLRWYSTSEHSVLISRQCREMGLPVRTQRTALMHDGSEAYLIDVPRPIKPYLGAYLEIEDRMMRAMAHRFDFDWPMPDVVKALDTSILHDERDQNMAPPPAPWPQLSGTSPIGVCLQFWTPDQAFSEFMTEAARLGVATM